VPELPERTALYRFYDADGALLYAGITDKPKRRWLQHSLAQPWWHLIDTKTVEWFDAREDALAAESQAVETEAPRYNAVRNADGSISRARYDDAAERRRALEGLRRDIDSGFYPLGAQLHLTHLAERYGVAASSVSSALSALPGQTIEYVGNRRFVRDPDNPRTPEKKIEPRALYQSTASWC
jgi:predicted GIY-YIG superfamily endonuclease